MSLPDDVEGLAGSSASPGRHPCGRETYEPIMPDLVGPSRGDPGQRRGRAALQRLRVAPDTRRLAGWASAALLLGVYPANIKMAIDAGQSDNTGFKAAAWGRLPLQLPMIRSALRAARG